ncbi:copper-binding protein NosD [Paenibacillus taihuensis]|uniref:Copper-binding protein NosD n=1 Tax=Paenibacillus taihuensis TaxID=1156355 RepID=A0A3D9RQ18_9BACL|nr:copper-binding protein NosD [Paenibacillus taihuensis]
MIEAEATDSKNNQLQGNYWDAFKGIDSDGDGASNVAYAIGDWVIAIGNPYGLDHTMTTGVLSAKERPITVTGEDGSENRCVD